jgi:hypothetical protein
MVNPRLTPDQLDLARALLDEVRARPVDLSNGDKELLFAYRRKLAKELSYESVASQWNVAGLSSSR